MGFLWQGAGPLTSQFWFFLLNLKAFLILFLACGGPQGCSDNSHFLSKAL